MTEFKVSLLLQMIINKMLLTNNNNNVKILVKEAENRNIQRF